MERREKYSGSFAMFLLSGTLENQPFSLYDPAFQRDQNHFLSSLLNPIR